MWAAVRKKDEALLKNDSNYLNNAIFQDCYIGGNFKKIKSPQMPDVIGKKAEKIVVNHNSNGQNNDISSKPALGIHLKSLQEPLANRRFET